MRCCCRCCVSTICRQKKSLNRLLDPLALAVGAASWRRLLFRKDRRSHTNPKPEPDHQDSVIRHASSPTSRLVIQTDSDDLQTPRSNGIWLSACRLLSEAAMT